MQKKNAELLYRSCFSVCILFMFSPLGLSAQELKPPDDFIGHRVGEDYKLARWEKIIEYFRYADENSDRVHTREI